MNLKDIEQLKKDIEDIEQLEKETEKRLSKAKGTKLVTQPVLTPEQMQRAALSSINYGSKNWQAYYDFAFEFLDRYKRDYAELKEAPKPFNYYYIRCKMRVYNYGIDEKIYNLILWDSYLSSVIGITLERKKEICKGIKAVNKTLYTDDVPDHIITEILLFCNKYIFAEPISKEKWEEISIFCNPISKPFTVTLNLIEGGRIVGKRDEIIRPYKPQPVKVKKVSWLAYLFDCLAERGLIIKTWKGLAGRAKIFASKNSVVITRVSFSRALRDFKTPLIWNKSLKGKEIQDDKRLQENHDMRERIDYFVKSLRMEQGFWTRKPANLT